MRSVTIARNYAEALVDLAAKANALEPWADLMDATAAAMSSSAIEPVLMSPRVTKEMKIKMVQQALHDAPPMFLGFIVAVLKRGRQSLLGMIADEYRTLVDLKLNRIRAGVTLARDVDEATRNALVERLSKAIGKQVIAGFSTDASLLGGTVIRIGDRIYDGSIRKRLAVLRQKLVAGR